MVFQSLIVICTPRRTCTQPLFWHESKQFVNDVHNIWLQFVWNLDLTICNLLEDFVINRAVERCYSYSHLVDHASECPQVWRWHSNIVVEHFRWNVKGSAYERFSRLATPLVRVFEEWVSVTVVIIFFLDSFFLFYIYLFTVSKVRLKNQFGLIHTCI